MINLQEITALNFRNKNPRENPENIALLVDEVLSIDQSMELSDSQRHRRKFLIDLAVKYYEESLKKVIRVDYFEIMHLFRIDDFSYEMISKLLSDLETNPLAMRHQMNAISFHLPSILRHHSNCLGIVVNLWIDGANFFFRKRRCRVTEVCFKRPTQNITLLCGARNGSE